MTALGTTQPTNMYMYDVDTAIQTWATLVRDEYSKGKDVGPLSKNSLVTLHLSPATRILNENPGTLSTPPTLLHD